MIKRFFDLLCVIPGIILLSPLFALVAVSIRLSSPGPILFRQTRVGRYGRLFRICKFRTMKPRENGAGPVITVDGDNRITSIGRLLRRYKLDELPQLLNVFNGDMSLVGPRPEVPEYVAKYPEDLRAKILSVRPGITDLASLEFRNESELLAKAKDPLRAYEEIIMPTKLRYYVQYVDKRTLWLDVQIVVRTIIAIVSS